MVADLRLSLPTAVVAANGAEANQAGDNGVALMALLTLLRPLL